MFTETFVALYWDSLIGDLTAVYTTNAQSERDAGGTVVECLGIPAPLAKDYEPHLPKPQRPESQKELSGSCLGG